MRSSEGFNRYFELAGCVNANANVTPHIRATGIVGIVVILSYVQDVHFVVGNSLTQRAIPWNVQALTVVDCNGHTVQPTPHNQDQR